MFGVAGLVNLCGECVGVFNHSVCCLGLNVAV